MKRRSNLSRIHINSKLTVSQSLMPSKRSLSPRNSKQTSTLRRLLSQNLTKPKSLLTKAQTTNKKKKLRRPIRMKPKKQLIKAQRTMTTLLKMIIMRSLKKTIKLCRGVSSWPKLMPNKWQKIKPLLKLELQRKRARKLERKLLISSSKTRKIWPRNRARLKWSNLRKSLKKLRTRSLPLSSTSLKFMIKFLNWNKNTSNSRRKDLTIMMSTSRKIKRFSSQRMSKLGKELKVGLWIHLRSPLFKSNPRWNHC